MTVAAARLIPFERRLDLIARASEKATTCDIKMQSLARGGFVASDLYNTLRRRQTRALNVISALRGASR